MEPCTAQCDNVQRPPPQALLLLLLAFPIIYKQMLQVQSQNHRGTWGVLLVCSHCCWCLFQLWSTVWKSEKLRMCFAPRNVVKLPTTGRKDGKMVTGCGASAFACQEAPFQCKPNSLNCSETQLLLSSSCLLSAVLPKLRHEPGATVQPPSQKHPPHQCG